MGKEMATSQDFVNWVCSEALVPEFLMYAFIAEGSDGLRAFGKGTTHTTIYYPEVKALHLCLPPPDEQQRIVAEIERQFTRLEVGVASLKRVQAALKRYRASVLKAACEGRLVPTEAELARRESRSYEPATTLLGRVLEKRQSSWSGRGKYKEAARPETTHLSRLPEGWMWASVEQLSNKVVDGVHKKPNYVPSGIPFVTVRNLTAGPGISFAKLNYVTEEAHAEFTKRANPESGDILVSKDGTLGVIRVINTDIQFSIFVSVALVKPVMRETSAYLTHALSSPQVQVQMVPKGSGLQHIHLEDLREDCIPVPPLAEQHRIVAEVERRLSVIEELEAMVAANLQRASRLRQAVLFRAFRGQMNSSRVHLESALPDPYVPGVTVSVPSLSAGVYTLPDAARLLQLPVSRLRSWVSGTAISDEDAAGHNRRLPAGKLSHRGEGRGRHFGFLTLIELFVIGHLREQGISMKKLRDARDELEERFNTPHPFALHGLITDGRSLLYNLGDDVLLELGENGQTAFRQVLEQFCQCLEFDEITQLVSRFYPAGRESAVVVDPRHGFGRPIIMGTNIATEAIASLVRGGDVIEDIAADFSLSPEQVADAWHFESRMAA